MDFFNLQLDWNQTEKEFKLEYSMKTEFGLCSRVGNHSFGLCLLVLLDIVYHVLRIIM